MKSISDILWGLKFDQTLIEFVEVETRKMITLFSSEDFLLFALTAKFME